MENKQSFTWTADHARDMVRYFLSPSHTLHYTSDGWASLFYLARIVHVPTDDLQSLLIATGAWPDPAVYPPASRRMFISHDCSIMMADTHIAQARSHTMAKRIAFALNRYTPDKRGR